MIPAGKVRRTHRPSGVQLEMKLKELVVDIPASPDRGAIV